MNLNFVSTRLDENGLQIGLSNSDRHKVRWFTLVDFDHHKQLLIKTGRIYGGVEVKTNLRLYSEIAEAVLFVHDFIEHPWTLIQKTDILANGSAHNAMYFVFDREEDAVMFKMRF